MKAIIFKIDIRLNHDDLIPVEVLTYLPDTPENREKAVKLSVDGTFAEGEIPDSVSHPTRLDAIAAQASYTALKTGTLINGGGVV